MEIEPLTFWNWLVEHGNNLITSIISIAALLVSMFTLTNSNTYQRKKSELWKDYARAEPLRQHPIESYFLQNKPQRHSCERYLTFLNNLNLKFLNNLIDNRYNECLKALDYLVNSHPDRNGATVYQDSFGQELIRHSPRYLEVYEPELKKWVLSWNDFMRFIEVETGPKSA